MSIRWQCRFERVLMVFDYLRIEGSLTLAGDEATGFDVLLDGICIHREDLSPLAATAPEANRRFLVSCLIPDVARRGLGLVRFQLATGRTIEAPFHERRSTPAMDESPAFGRFLRLVRERAGATVLEVGSRARSGVSVRDQFAGCDYLGVDVLAGDNVDVVVDAHEMSGQLGRNRFDFAFSLDVFEHLAMPWKAVVELNRVLKPGGVAYVLAPQSCGLHEQPWDFWRLSQGAFRALFNPSAGFEVLETESGEPMHLFPFVHHSPLWDGCEQAMGYARVAVLARKIAETTLEWPVPTASVVDGSYPA